jgi:iron complex outermembrane receptor protein
LRERERNVSVADGNLEKNATARIGGTLTPDATYRVYALGFERGSLDLPSGSSADDGWSKTQVGFRTDWTPKSTTVTVQGDAYCANENQSGTTDLSIAGANLPARWQQQFTPDSALQVEAYYGESQRFNGGGGGAFVLHTYDFELQHSFAPGGINSVVWGAGERVSRYGITNTAGLLFLPDQRTLSLANGFVQDSIALSRKFKLSLGIKTEDDPYSGTTPLPNARLAWNVSDTALLWSAVSPHPLANSVRSRRRCILRRRPLFDRWWRLQTRETHRLRDRLSRLPHLARVALRVNVLQ